MTGTVLVVTARIRKELKNLDMLKKEIVKMLERGAAESDSEGKGLFHPCCMIFTPVLKECFRLWPKV